MADILTYLADMSTQVTFRKIFSTENKSNLQSPAGKITHILLFYFLISFIHSSGTNAEN